jgi:hypothetical protein
MEVTLAKSGYISNKFIKEQCTLSQPSNSDALYEAIYIFTHKIFSCTFTSIHTTMHTTYNAHKRS